MDQMARVRGLISREAPADGDRPAAVGWMQRLCRAAARDLPATGVGVSVLSRESYPTTVAASNEASALVEELQFTMGEGPCIDAYASRMPVLVPDLSVTAVTTWPGYAPAAHDHGVRAVFAFPLQVGAARLGALDVYRDQTGSLSREALSSAMTFAEVAIQGLLDAGSGAQDALDLVDDAEGNRFEVYQAQGMLMVQLGVNPEEALTRLRAYAYAHDRRAIEVARDIIERRVNLESDA